MNSFSLDSWHHSSDLLFSPLEIQAGMISYNLGVGGEEHISLNKIKSEKAGTLEFYPRRGIPNVRMRVGGDFPAVPGKDALGRLSP